MVEKGFERNYQVIKCHLTRRGIPTQAKKVGMAVFMI